MTERTRDEFPRDFPIFPKETTTPNFTAVETVTAEPDQETVIPEVQETSSKVKLILNFQLFFLNSFDLKLNS